MKKTHMVIVANNIDGGVGTFLGQIHSLQTNNVNISLLTLKKEINASLPHFSYTASLTQEKPATFQIFKEALWLKKEIEKQNPDSILSVDVHASFLLCVLKILFFKKLRVIISNRNNVRKISKEKFSYPVQKFLQLLGHYLFMQADTIVCVSQGLAKDFKEFFFLKKQVDCIDNSIDIPKANVLGKKSIEEQDKRFFSHDRKTILSIGRLEKQKDFQTLIQAMQAVSKKIPDVQLLIIGDGSQKEKLQSLIKELHLEKTVFILGWRNNVYPYLRKADLFVLSSHYEGFGYVLLEAMSQGIPIISTDSPFGPSEVLSSGTYGVLTPVGNPQMMAANIVKLLRDKKLQTYYAQQSKKRAGDFSEKKLLRRYADLLL